MKNKKRLENRKFCPITAETAKDWYQKKYLATPGYLLIIKEILRPPGVDLKIDRVSEFCNHWGISRAAFYRAVSTITTNNDGEWTTSGTITLSTRSITDDCPTNGQLSHEQTTVSRTRQLSHERDNCLTHETQNPTSETQNPTSETQGHLQPLADKASSSLQTLQTLQTNQTLQTEEGEGEKTFSLEKNEQEKSCVLSQKSEVGNKEGSWHEESGIRNQNSEARSLRSKSELGVQNTESEVGNTEGSRGKCATPEVPSQRKKKIPQELINKLEELEIPLDKAVRSALANHHLSQAYGAVAHVERTWETIDNPRAIFLYQLPKQPVEKAPKGLNQEFLDWYKSAVAEGIVEDLPPRYLSTNCYNEPLVRLKRPDPCTGAPYTLVEWRRVQLEPDYDPHQKVALKKVSSLEDIKELLEQLRQEKLGNDD